jgi:hypothetical protein
MREDQLKEPIMNHLFLPSIVAAAATDNFFTATNITGWGITGWGNGV